MRGGRSKQCLSIKAIAAVQLPYTTDGLSNCQVHKRQRCKTYREQHHMWTISVVMTSMAII